MLLAGMLNLAFAQDTRVVIAHATTHVFHAEDVRHYLMCTQAFAEIDLYDASVSTPTLGYLQSYDTLLVFSELGVGFADPVALGDVAHAFLADGGGVTVAGAALDQAGGASLGGQLAPAAICRSI